MYSFITPAMSCPELPEKFGASVFDCINNGCEEEEEDV
jgi:hypothetical protein